MLQHRALFFLFLVSFVSIQSQTWPEFFVQDAKDTLSTGIPVALSAVALWYWANRIPNNWKTVTGPVADFIYTTWKEQGLIRKRPIALKCIPRDSVLGKTVVYTQELPSTVAIGEPFIKKIKKLLDSKKNFLTQPKTLQREIKLQAIEDQLDECRFVCGHERVHKERNHTYKFLILQTLAPFVIYSSLKHTRALLIHKKVKTPFDWAVSRGLTRSSLEVLVGLVFARYVECKADMYASDDIKILRAGLRLFERAQNSKAQHPVKKPSQYIEVVMKWVFKYAHPTLIERIAYMKRRIAYLEKKREQRRNSAL